MAVFVRCCSCDTQHMGVIASHICMESTQSASITAVEACHKKSDWSHSFRQNVLHIHKRGRLFSFLSTDPVLVLFSGACALCWAFLRAAVMACLGIYCTFEVGSDAGIISWRPPHELVQEVRRRQLWSCPAGGLYLLLTGAQSDITQGGREGGRESGNKYKEKGAKRKEREREDLENGRSVWEEKMKRKITKSVISKIKSPAVEMKVKNDDWMFCLSWQLKAYLLHIMSQAYCGC